MNNAVQCTMMITLLDIQILIMNGCFSKMCLCSEVSDILPQYGRTGDTEEDARRAGHTVSLLTTGVPTAVLLNTWRSMEGWGAR